MSLPSATRMSVRTLLLALAVAAVALSQLLAAEPSRAASDCEPNELAPGWVCVWGAQSIGVNSWSFFDAPNPKRNWYRNSGVTNYSNPTPKCVRVGKGGGDTYAQFCDTGHEVRQNYPRCNCGGLYAGTKNIGNGPRFIISYGWH